MSTQCAVDWAALLPPTLGSNSRYVAGRQISELFRQSVPILFIVDIRLLVVLGQKPSRFINGIVRR